MIRTINQIRTEKGESTMKKAPKKAKAPKAAKKASPIITAIKAVISLATAAATCIYLVNKFHGNIDINKMPTPDQILHFKKKQ